MSNPSMSNPSMSDPAASHRTRPPLDPKIGLMFAAADQLAPLFQTRSIDAPLAQQMAASAIDAYLPETRADFINIARTIAFSMAALALLGQTTSQDMTMPEKMRAFGRANALNRSADQSERTMMQRRRYQQANPPAEPQNPWPELPMPESSTPDTDPADAEIQAAIAEVMKEYLAACEPPATEAAAPEAPPEPAPTAPRTATPPPSPAVSPIDPPAASPPTAIRFSGLTTDAGQPWTTTYKNSLLRHSAMQRVVEPAHAHQSPGQNNLPMIQR